MFELAVSDLQYVFFSTIVSVWEKHKWSNFTYRKRKCILYTTFIPLDIITMIRNSIVDVARNVVGKKTACVHLHSSQWTEMLLVFSPGSHVADYGSKAVSKAVVLFASFLLGYTKRWTGFRVYGMFTNLNDVSTIGILSKFLLLCVG